MGEAMTSQDESQLELLPLSIRERIEAAAKRFLEREDRKARKDQAADMPPLPVSRHEAAQHDEEVAG